MDDFDHGVEANLEQRCAVCGVELSDAEIEASREAGGPFMCMVHADEEAPAGLEGPGEELPAD